MPEITVPCYECGESLLYYGTCGKCGSPAWTHIEPRTSDLEADKAAERRVWHCRSPRCDAGGHVILRGVPARG